MADPTLKKFAVKITSDTTDLQTGFDKLKIKLEELSVSFKQTFSMFDSESKKISQELSQTIGKNVSNIGENAKSQITEVQKAMDEKLKAVTKGSEEEKAIRKQAKEDIKKIQKDANKAQTTQLKQQTQEVAKELKNQLKTLDREAEQFGELDVVQINKTQAIEDVQELGRVVKSNNKTTQEEIRTQLKRLDSQKIEDIKDAEQKLKRVLAGAQRNQTQAAKEAATRRKRAAGNNAEKLEKIEKDLQKQLLRIQQQGQARRQAVTQTSARRQQRAPQERRTGRIGRGGALISELGGAAQRATGSMGMLGGALGKLGPIGIAVGAALGATIGILLKAGEAAGKLGNEIAKVKTTINTEQFDELNGATQKLRDFSAQTGVELSELTDGMFNAASAVSAFKDDVNAGAEAVIIASKAAVGMSTDSGNLVSVMGDLANSFQIDASETENLNFIMDTVSQTFRDGKISGDELSSTIVKAAKSTSLLSADAKEGLTALNAMTASMTASGINAAETSTAINALQNEFLDLPKATKLIESGLGGISTEGGKVQVNFKELFESAGDDFEKYAQLLGSKQAKLAFRTLAGGGESAFQAISAGFEDVSGRSETAFEIMQTTSEAASKRMDASLNELMISIGGATDSAMTSLTNFAAGALQSVAELFKSAEAEASQTQEHFDQIIETAKTIGDSVISVQEAITAAGETGADEAGIVSEEIKKIGEVTKQFKDEFPIVADNIERIINAKGELTIDTLKEVNEQLLRLQELSEAEAFLSGMEAADANLELMLDRFDELSDSVEDFLPEMDLLGLSLEDLPDKAGSLKNAFDENKVAIEGIRKELEGVDKTTIEGKERARELRDEYKELGKAQRAIGNAQLALTTNIEGQFQAQIENARKFASINKKTFDAEMEIALIREDLLATFGAEGQTLELINNLTNERLDSELKISEASKETAESTEEVTEETEKSLAANEALADVLKEQRDISEEKSFIESEINELTSEILDNETLTTDAKIEQLEKLERAFEIELNMLNAKIKGLEADHQRAIVAAQSKVLTEFAAQAEWDKADALKDQLSLLQKQAAIVGAAKTEIEGKITETGAGGLVTDTLGGIGGGGGRGAQRAERDRQRAEKDRQKEEDKAAKEAAKVEKDRQKEIESAEKERIKLEESHNEELKKTFDAEVEQIERSAERMRAIDDLDHERRMRQINAQQEFEDEQRKLNEERIQREKQLNDRLTQIREQQLGELKGIAQTTSGAIQDIIKSLVPLTKREQLLLTIDQTGEGLRVWNAALENSQIELEEGTEETIEGSEDTVKEYGRLTRQLESLRADRSNISGNIGSQERNILANQASYDAAKESNLPGNFASIQAFEGIVTDLLNLEGKLEETDAIIAKKTERYKELQVELGIVDKSLEDSAAEYQQNAEAMEQADVNKVIGEQAILAQQLGFVANEFRVISNLSEGLFTQESADKAQIFFDELSINSLVMKDRLQKMFPGDLVTNFELKLEELNTQIEVLTESGKNADLLSQAVVNAQSLEALIGILTKDMADMTNQMNAENLKFIQDLIDSESMAADAVGSIQEDVNRLQEIQEEKAFETQEARVRAEIAANERILLERKKLLEKLLTTLDPEKDFEEFTAIKQELNEIGNNIVKLNEIKPELIEEGSLQTQQTAIDNQKILIDQQEQLGEVSSIKALRERLEINDDQLSLAIDRKDSEEEINKILLERKGIEDTIFQKQLDSLNNIAKNAELVSDSISSLSDIQSLFAGGERGEGTQAAGDLTTKIGKALLNSKSSTLGTMGAVLLGVGIFTKIIGKIISLIQGKEKSALDFAEERLQAIELQNESIRGQIDLMNDLVALNSAAFDTATERLRALEKQRQAIISQNKELDKSHEQLLRDKADLQERNDLLESYDSRLEKSKEFSNDEQRRLIKEVNESFGTAFDFGDNIKKSDIDEVIAFVSTQVARGQGDMATLELLTELNQSILDEQFAVLDQRIKQAEFKIKIATELDDPDTFLKSQEEILEVYRDKLNKSLSDAGIEFGFFRDLTQDELLGFIEFLSSATSGPIPDSVIDSWNELFGAIENVEESQEDYLKSQLEDQKQMIELIRLREKAGKITTEEADKQISDILEEQIAFMKEQIELLGWSVELEMTLLDLEIQLVSMKKEGNEEDAESNRLLTEALRKRQQLLETFRVETGGGALSTEQANRLAQSEKTIVDQLRASGASEAEIQKFLDSLPAFEEGGKVPVTGPAIVHEGELIIPANQVKEMENQIKSFASIFAANNPTIMGTDAITQDFTRTVLENEAKNIQQSAQFNTQFGDIIINIPVGVQEPDKIAIAVKNELSNMVLGTVQRGIDQNKIDIRGKKT